jgi:hypothetical protein
MILSSVGANSVSPEAYAYANLPRRNVCDKNLEIISKTLEKHKEAAELLTRQ